jgi:saccharopine dehydrogenase-like NADP-dependent oxidoreductase
MKAIGIIGSTGHFGKIIAEDIISSMQDYNFILYGRNVPSFKFPNILFQKFDFNKDDTLPGLTDNLLLVIDLSGPVKEADGKALIACTKNNIPYMDMALHNSHMQLLKSIKSKYDHSTVLAHFGLFPGLSNLIIAKGFEIQKKKSGILVNEFPAYAGGGKNVSLSLKDMLNESRYQKNIRNNKMEYFTMHTVGKNFMWNGKTKRFYKWEYPEIESFLYSNPDTVTLERYFSIKPSFLNKSFEITIKIWNTAFHNILEKIIPKMLYYLKSAFFKRNDPSMKMKFYDESGSKCLIELNVKSAVKFHGNIMKSFIQSFIQKNIATGLFTPEQLFTLDEILIDGIYDDYELIYHI